MEKKVEEVEKVEEVVISPEGIDVIYRLGSAIKITQINLEIQEDEKNKLLENNRNLIDLKLYPIDMNVVRTLVDNQEQLDDYLDTCRRLYNSKQKVDLPESILQNIPQITYDLKELRGSFEEIDDENLRKSRQIELYNEAKQTQNTFKGVKGKAQIKMRMIDRAYFAVQELLQNRNKTEVKALNPGITGPSREWRREYYNVKYREYTNEISEKYADVEEKENVEKESEEIIDR